MTSDPIVDYTNVDYPSRWQEPERRTVHLIEDALVRSLVKSFTGDWAADLGGGFGRLTPLYQEKAKRVVLLDYSERMLETARERFSGSAQKPLLVLGDVQKAPFRNGVFSLVALMRVFHHFPNPAACLKDIQRITRQNGLFLFSYYNRRKLSAIIRYWLGKTDLNPFQRAHTPAGPGLYFTHPGYVRDLLASLSFRVLKTYHIGLFIELLGKWGVNPRRLEFALQPVARLFAPANTIYNACRLERAAVSPAEGPLDSERDIFQCPSCGHFPLNFAEQDAVSCGACRRRYPRRSDIYDFRLNP